MGHQTPRPVLSRLCGHKNVSGSKRVLKELTVGWAGSQTEDNGHTSVMRALASGASGGWDQRVRNGLLLGVGQHRILLSPFADMGTEDQRG